MRGANFLEAEVRSFTRLTVSEVNILLRDLDLQLGGARISYVVDPHELFDFCFPFDPRAERLAGIDEIADAQVALYDLFYAQSERPILPEEYIQETDVLRRTLLGVASAGFRKAELISRLMAESGLMQVVDGPGKILAVATEVQRIVESDFNLVLAVGMGIYSIGTERFVEVLDRRTQKGLLSDQDSIAREIDSRYKPTAVFSAISTHLEKTLRAKGLTAIELAQRSRHARFDARIIDRLLWLNQGLEDAYNSGRLKNRRVFLYLSSARRNRQIFRVPAVSRSLPRVDGRAFQIWRSREQLFAGVAYRSPLEGPAGVGDSRDNLVRLKSLITALQRSFRAPVHDHLRCESCVLRGSADGNCEWREFCESVREAREAVERSRRSGENIGLMQRYDHYRRVVEAATQTDGEYKWLRLLKELTSGGVRDWVIEGRIVAQEMTRARKELLGLLPLAVRTDEQRPFLRGDGRQAVTAMSQYLPLYPKIQQVELRRIWEAIAEYYRTPASGAQQKAATILRAYQGFSRRDKELRGAEPEHELVRCLLYLAAGDSHGDRLALNYGDQMSRKFEGYEAEFLYVSLWAARRAREFARGEKLASRGVSSFPGDARLVHGRALNRFAWLSDPGPGLECPFDLQACVDDVRAALALYAAETPARDDMVAACCNNLAYFLAYDSADPVFDLKAARRALEDLKKLSPKVDWPSHFPEYLHTEAHLEYHEFTRDFATESDRARLLKKLEAALADIRLAIVAFPEKEIYRRLREDLERALARAR
jgi:hypothetical protein